MMAWRSGQSYSADLRGRVLTAVDEGSAIAAMAELFRVSVSYIYKALARRRQTGETEARPQRSHQAPKLAAHHEAIRAEVARRPDVTLDELRAWLKAEYGVSASLGLMHNTLARLDLTRKKDWPGARAGSAGYRPRPRSLACPAGRSLRAADLHRRDRGGYQDGAPIRPEPARPAPGLCCPIRPLEDDDLPRRPQRQRLHRSLRAHGAMTGPIS